MTGMFLVVDANVVISSLVKKGVTFEVFILNHILKKFEFAATPPNGKAVIKLPG